MNIRISPSSPTGTLKAIASKSAAHRLLICAAFADAPTVIRCEELNEDICATVRCLEALGAIIERNAPYYTVTPIGQVCKTPVLNCGESGSTLRFLLPVVCALGETASFEMAGRLPNRPLSPLREELERHGISFSAVGSNPLRCSGHLIGTEFSIPANVSSQFISGLLFALAASKQVGKIDLEGVTESTPYIDMTVAALREFGISVYRGDNILEISENRGLHSPCTCLVEGDWSSAAFPLCLGAMGRHPVTVIGLASDSRQGDRAIISLLQAFGAKVDVDTDRVTVTPASLRGIDIDASQIPDLVPVLATVASVAEGCTRIFNASRLRIKESDRLQTTRAMLNALGADVTETEDGLVIQGVKRLRGGRVSSFGDHRVAMSAAVASVGCEREVIIEDAQAAAKSYPDFWKDLQVLGVQLEQQ